MFLFPHSRLCCFFFFAVLPPASVPVPLILPLISFPLPYRPCLMLFNVPLTTYIADEPVLRSTDNSRKCTTLLPQLLPMATKRPLPLRPSRSFSVQREKTKRSKQGIAGGNGNTSGWRIAVIFFRLRPYDCYYISGRLLRIGWATLPLYRIIFLSKVRSSISWLVVMSAGEKLWGRDGLRGGKH